MSTKVYTPTAEEVQARVGRFSALQPMSTATDLDVPQSALDIVFARKIMPVILERSKNPFGNLAPIYEAAGTTMFISVMPPGQGPCLHNHHSTFETFMVLQGSIQYEIGDPVVHKVVLNQWDTFSCPPGVYRGFRNVGTVDAVQLTVITGVVDNHDDVTMPHGIEHLVLQQEGPDVLRKFKTLFEFDPPAHQGASGASA